MMYLQRMLGFSAGLLLLGCAASPVSTATESEFDSRLLGQWSCQLQLSEGSAETLASWTETLKANGVLEGKGSSTSAIGGTVIQSHFSGRGRWSAQGGVYRNNLDSVELKMEGDAAAIDRLNKEEVRQGFLVPSVESYELHDGRWIRRKSGAASVTVCQRAI